MINVPKPPEPSMADSTEDIRLTDLPGGCPPWCISHDQSREGWLDHASEQFTLSRHDVPVATVRVATVDVPDLSTRVGPMIMVDVHDGLTADEAGQLAVAIADAATTAGGWSG